MSEALLKEIYTEILRKKLDMLEVIIVPEEISSEELEEIEELKKESLEGESVRWEKIKKDLL
jgi:hypothetical protein